MCGRYGRRGNKQKISEAFRVKGGLEEVDFGDTLDAAPGSIQPVVFASEAAERDLRLMRWGFKLPDRLLFNTRSDNVLSFRFWKDRFSEHRCIVPASYFIEWQDVGKGKKKPKFDISVPGRDIVGFAGLWSTWKNPRTEKWEDTFSVFTTDPNPKMIEFHDRQPVILDPREYEEWLTPSERLPVHLLRILPEDQMLIQPAEGSIPAAPAAPAQPSLFG